ncbi:MAG: hypothetical protein H6858_07000 [Rhodospirillales bacterium]|nr:hypothetical protein [Alphaproteobacteria bacterium]MCB1840422.1 hypothetical protein [Alphaproteobacteria bacterium]MCB9977327.1 hypothetical protein [Rhodospirillales bacterium]
MNDFVLWAVGQLVTLVILTGMFPVINKELQTPVSTPSYCIESHPDYDQKKCETEQPLYRWRRIQEERIKRKSEWREKGCKCSEIPDSSKSEKEECEQACGLRPYPDYEFEDAQTDSECNPASPDYNEEKCKKEDPLYRWRSLQQENLSRGQICEMCKKPLVNEAIEEGEEDPLARWRKIKCERVCNEAKQE